MRDKFQNISKFILRHKGISFIVIMVLCLGCFAVPKIFAQPQAIRSVEIYSEKLDYSKKEPGAWKVEKSAKWVGKGEAEITFDVDTIMKSNSKYTDVLFVLDVSGSMNGDKLERVKTDTIQLIESLLSNGNNRAGLITFESSSQIVTDFISDKDELISMVNDLSTLGATNYYQAFINVDSILKNYVKKDDRDCIVLFLTDGSPNVEIPNEEAQYNYLKSQYPFVKINGIQYEMGDTVLEPIKKVSDNQFLADMEILNNVLFEASVSPVTYDSFEITDYIDTNYFYVESEKDIKVSQGSVIFDKTNQKFTWNIDNLNSGSKAKMTINAKLKDAYIGEGGFYPTNEKEEIKSKIDEYEEDEVSTKTPVLADNYRVIYDGNAPSGCKVEGVPEEKQYSVFDTVAISDAVPKCEGYQFKGWKITTENVKKVNDDYFTMPEEDVKILGTWSKLDLNKSMEGEVRENLTLYKQVKKDYEENNGAKKYTGSTETFNGNQDVYYYYGENPNNNILFGGFCWRMYRTTDTGGVKMIYNGKPDSDGKCLDKNSSIGTSSFNSHSSSLSDAGYMYNKRYDSKRREIVERTILLSRESLSTSYYYADGIEFGVSSDKMFNLIEPYKIDSKDNYYDLVGKYTFASDVKETTKNSVYYIIGVRGSFMYAIKLSSDVPTVTLANTSYYFADSLVDDGTGKQILDSTTFKEVKRIEWYDSYADYKCKYYCETLECANIYYVTSTSEEDFKAVNIANDYVYGNAFTYDEVTGEYILSGEKHNFWNFEGNIDKLSNAHYTCFNTTGRCKVLSYIYNSSFETPYYINLENGTSIEKALDEMLYDDNVNTTDSMIKAYIDTWYADNLVQYTDYLEDAVWCNDRRMSNKSSNGWNPNGGSTETDLDFIFSSNISSLTCPNRNDRFTVNVENGNGALTYPVGLVTFSEYFLGSDYLQDGNFWTLSPSRYDNLSVSVRYFGTRNKGSSPFSRYGVRPSISLRSGIGYYAGDGSVDRPYVIDMDLDNIAK